MVSGLGIITPVFYLFGLPAVSGYTHIIAGLIGLSRPQIRKFHSRVAYNIPEYQSIRSKTRE